MSGYTKLFETILDSSVWFESPATRLVWITLLAMKNRNGVVAASVMGVAHRARVTLEEAKAALEKFQSPDPFSRTKDFDGRRIEEVDGGWKILNHANQSKTLSTLIEQEVASRFSVDALIELAKSDPKDAAVVWGKLSAECAEAIVLLEAYGRNAMERFILNRTESKSPKSP